MASHTAILANHQVAQGAWAARVACVLRILHRVVIRTANRPADPPTIHRADHLVSTAW